MDDGGRSKVLDALFAELIGPSTEYSVPGQPTPRPLELAAGCSFPGYDEARGLFVEAGTGEEVLGVRPTQRYGVGVLYPLRQLTDDEGSGEDSDEPESMPEVEEHVAEESDPLPDPEPGAAEVDSDDFDLSGTAQYKPSSMAISFLAEMAPGQVLVVRATGGRYAAVQVEIGGRPFVWWVRRAVAIQQEFACPSGSGPLQPLGEIQQPEGLDLRIRGVAREEGAAWLVTVALVNNAEEPALDRCSLFQSRFAVTVEHEGAPLEAFLPYPDRKSEMLLESDQEARSLDLLYRGLPVFAIGHGCAATWKEAPGKELCSRIVADPLPTYEAPSVTPDVRLADGSVLAVPMGPLSGLDEDDDGFRSMRAVLDSYREWIAGLEAKQSQLAGRRAETAALHIERCRRAANRMERGLQWLMDDPMALRAFRLANRAVLEQQMHAPSGVRRVEMNKQGLPEVSGNPPERDWRAEGPRWRAFQIGFLLGALRSAVLDDDADRETVDLIFFPTGGGKTEAYQALAAFSLLYRRLQGVRTGVDVILRYTLRLLTGQQFLRAAALVCAMELIRRNEPDLGDDEFSIGIWVGQAITPTTRAKAVSQAADLLKGKSTDNPFLLLRCPWCGAQMGQVKVAKGAPKDTPRSVGYREVGGTVKFVCPDRTCAFNKGIPAYVIDEDVYAKRPSILVSTIDKFAMLAYWEQARRIFGLAADGSQEVDPPNLIIQDELHLIAGPLGSIAGLYEAVIEDLCTRRSGAEPVRPKIVASTATIRRYEAQVLALYGRSSAELFPPHGLDAADSFFATQAVDPDTGGPAQGRLYVGVHAPGLGSMQTVQVRSASALLQAGQDMPTQEQDPWSTLMMFFNSLRELGTSVSLFQSDIPDYLKAMLRRSGRPLGDRRLFDEPLQLTANLPKEELPGALGKLEVQASDRDSIDVCLASNIIEVGVDIPRLSLMVVVGQPKTTSQYIQVTGRVGRRWQDRPGLVVMLYGASKPRDRSHFERFLPYHQRLYAEVEPVSVTPFAPPVIQRAAHAATIAYVRQRAVQGTQPWPLPQPLADAAVGLLDARAQFIDPDELARVKERLARRMAEWTAWEPQKWLGTPGEEAYPLMRRAGQWVPSDVERKSWAVPMSMRDVDAECRGAATDFFSLARLGDDEVLP